MIDITAVSQLRGEPAPLYKRYTSQTAAQPAYIELSEHGTVTAYYSADVGNAIPMYVWHARALRWRVPADVTGDALAAFIERPDVLQLLERIHAGHSVAWDGNNRVGLLTADAQDARDDLQRLIEQDLDDEACASIWEAADWFSNASIIDVWPPELTLDDAAMEAEDEARNVRIVLEGDVRGALLRRALRAFEDGDDRLRPTHVSALLDARMIDRSEYDAWVHARKVEEEQ